jgi:hypothetical protein
MNSLVEIRQHPLYVIAQSHITCSDATLLEKHNEEKPNDPFVLINTQLIAHTRPSTLLWIGDQGLPDHADTLLKEIGYSIAFRVLLNIIYRQAKRSCYLLIVPSGYTIPDFPTYQW